jgi:hypothetical protein
VAGLLKMRFADITERSKNPVLLSIHKRLIINFDHGGWAWHVDKSD